MCLKAERFIRTFWEQPFGRKYMTTRYYDLNVMLWENSHIFMKGKFGNKFWNGGRFKPINLQHQTLYPIRQDCLTLPFSSIWWGEQKSKGEIWFPLSPYQLATGLWVSSELFEGNISAENTCFDDLNIMLWESGHIFMKGKFLAKDLKWREVRTQSLEHQKKML